MGWGQYIGAQLMAAASTRDPQAPTLAAVSLDVQAPTAAVRQHYADLGRVGGKKGGIVRAQRLTPERRSEIARMGAIARREKLKSHE